MMSPVFSLIGILFFAAFKNHYSENFTLQKVTRFKSVTKRETGHSKKLLRRFQVRQEEGDTEMLSSRLNGSALSLSPVVPRRFLVLCTAVNFHPWQPVNCVSLIQVGWMRSKLRLGPNQRQASEAADTGPQGSLTVCLPPPKLISIATGHRGLSHLRRSTAFLAIGLGLHSNLVSQSWFIGTTLREDSCLFVHPGSCGLDKGLWPQLLRYVLLCQNPKANGQRWQLRGLFDAGVICSFLAISKILRQNLFC